MPQDVILVDRSRLETHWRCARRRYWNYEYDHTGIAPVDFAWPLTFGIILHEQAAKLMRIATSGIDDPHEEEYFQEQVKETIDLTFQAGMKYPLMDEERAHEWAALAGGLIAGTAQKFIPAILKECEVELIEGELYYDIPGNPIVRIMVTPDLILRHRVTQELHYHEYKTTSARDMIKWCKSWTYQPQLHIGCKAIEAHFNEPCKHAIVQGWNKGYEAYGRLNSNLIWGYRDGNGITQRGYKYGWDRFLVKNPWGWVKTFTDEEWSMHFPQTLPVGFNEHLVHDFTEQVALRERSLYHSHQHLTDQPEDLEWILNLEYPQAFNQCEPSFGERCPFLEACHNPTVNADPLNSSFYVRREPHHKMEIEHAK